MTAFFSRMKIFKFRDVREPLYSNRYGFRDEVSAVYGPVPLRSAKQRCYTEVIHGKKRYSKKFYYR